MRVIPDIGLPPYGVRTVVESAYWDRHSLLLIDEMAVSSVPRIFRRRTESHAREPLVMTNVQVALLQVRACFQ